MRICDLPECQNVHEAHGLCRTHYRKLHGYPSDKKTRKSWKGPEEEFWSRVDKSGDCWIWKGSKTKLGYGHFSYHKKVKLAHRYAFEITKRVSLGKMHIDHMCHNTSCVNPAHLRPVTHKLNMENRKSAHRNSRTGVRNVQLKRGKYVVVITHNKIRHYIGAFETIEQAEAEAVAARKRIFTHSMI